MGVKRVEPLRERLRPASLAPGRVAACLGLISDTHFGDRLLALPEAVPRIFEGTDLILHGGDVGELRVLDELGHVAPVVAVHGNDERFADAPRDLPYHQVVYVAGQRIVLTHAHYPDYGEEMAARRDDAWAPKLARRAVFGRAAAAKIVVYGHTHVATDVVYEGVRLVNPGALASGNFAARQFRKTVALLYLRDDGAPYTVHVDVTQPDRPYTLPEIDWNAGFAAAMLHSQESIVAPDFRPAYAALRERARSLGSEVFEAVRAAVAVVAHRCWSGELERYTKADVVAALKASPDLPAEALHAVLETLETELSVARVVPHRRPLREAPPTE
jgi:hypothetical protein